MTWVVENRARIGDRELVGYWYGPEWTFGTTSGGLDGAATFTTKGLAEAALRRTFGTLAYAKRRGYRPVKRDEAPRPGERPRRRKA